MSRAHRRVRSFRRRWRAAAAAAWAVFISVALVAATATWVADWRLLSVDSGSMTPAVPEGALAVVAPVAAVSIEVGDVIRFPSATGDDVTVLHRVTGVTSTTDGRRAFRTRGDANPAPDPVPVADTAVLGRLVFHVPRLGPVLAALRPPWGTLLLGGVPLLVLGLSALQGRRRIATDDKAEALATEPA